MPEEAPKRAEPPSIVCQGVWKIFGPDPRGLLREPGGSPTAADLARTGHVAAVRDVSITIHANEIFVVMGLSGSGKSTLVRCMARLIEPTAGSIEVDGRDLLALDTRELTEFRRHHMAMVFQHFALLPHDTVLGNVAFPLEIRGARRADREKRALEMIELVGLTGREGYYPRELSGGQQQRVGIARALTIDPEILFLDEPFSALDPLIRREMQDELMRLQNVLRKTIVFITHDFDEAIRLADRIAIMRDGGIVQVGTPEEFVVAPLDDYVRAFTKNVPRAKVLTARSLMTRLDEPDAARVRVHADERIEALAARLIDANLDAVVVDDKGGAVGLLRRRRVLDALMNRA
ncbi:MAG: quaternary amine ABC transporter ATP-binding protein [Alphaproteobacteria bacterium]